MKKGEFDLTGKSVDCSGLPALDDKGKEIFRALKVACNGVDNGQHAQWINLEDFSHLKLTQDGAYEFCYYNSTAIQPSDVLGQAAIDAAMDGATIVFEGDVIPSGAYIYYQDSRHNYHMPNVSCEVLQDTEILAYKPIEAPDVRLAKAMKELPARVLAEKVGSKHSHYFKDVSDLNEVDVYRVCDLFEVDDHSGATHHAIKKLLCSGKRGAKDARKDLEEARDTIIRKLQLLDKDK